MAGWQEQADQARNNSINRGILTGQAQQSEIQQALQVLEPFVHMISGDLDGINQETVFWQGRGIVMEAPSVINRDVGSFQLTLVGSIPALRIESEEVHKNLFGIYDDYSGVSSSYSPESGNSLQGSIKKRLGFHEEVVGKLIHSFKIVDVVDPIVTVCIGYDSKSTIYRQPYFIEIRDEDKQTYDHRVGQSGTYRYESKPSYSKFNWSASQVKLDLDTTVFINMINGRNGMVSLRERQQIAKEYNQQLAARVNMVKGKQISLEEFEKLK